MARWAQKVSASFEDMPKRLRHVDADSPPKLKQARAAWLEEHSLAFVDFIAWRRAKDPLAKLRPPSRRKLMSAEQLADLDAQREREGEQPPW
jgi:hypothetical protein